jgi:hypothetical protein
MLVSGTYCPDDVRFNLKITQGEVERFSKELEAI